STAPTAAHDRHASGPQPPAAPHVEAAEVAAPARGEHAAPADPTADVERLLRMATAPRAMRDAGELRLQVGRDGLGQDRGRVAVRDHAVHATLVAENDNARDALIASRPTLAASLERSNLRLEGFTVGLGQHQQGRPDRQGGDRPASFTTSPEPLAVAPVAA